VLREGETRGEEVVLWVSCDLVDEGEDEEKKKIS